LALKVKLDPKAKTYLKKKGKTITVSRLEVQNCCVPIEEANVSFFEPVCGNYIQVKEDDLTIYIESNLMFKNDEIELKLIGFKPFQNIQVCGLQRF